MQEGEEEGWGSGGVTGVERGMKGGGRRREGGSDGSFSSVELPGTQTETHRDLFQSHTGPALATLKFMTCSSSSAATAQMYPVRMQCMHVSTFIRVNQSEQCR